jgi:hypothetical protein
MEHAPGARQRLAAAAHDIHLAAHRPTGRSLHPLLHRRVFLRLRSRGAPPLAHLPSQGPRTRANGAGPIPPDPDVRLHHPRPPSPDQRAVPPVRNFHRRGAARAASSDGRPRSLPHGSPPRKLRSDARGRAKTAGTACDDGHVRGERQQDQRAPGRHQSCRETRRGDAWTRCSRFTTAWTTAPS